MSCITIVGRAKRWNAACDVPLPRSVPEWTNTKMRRLNKFASSDNPALRAIAASHPQIGVVALTELLFDEDVTVRRAAVKNVKITDTQLRIAMMDHDLGVAAYARLLYQED